MTLIKLDKAESFLKGTVVRSCVGKCFNHRVAFLFSGPLSVDVEVSLGKPEVPRQVLVCRHQSVSGMGTEAPDALDDFTHPCPGFWKGSTR